jgi:hypothetical protein
MLSILDLLKDIGREITSILCIEIANKWLEIVDLHQFMLIEDRSNVIAIFLNSSKK